MEIILPVIGIIGGAGLLAFLQAKSPLPSAADFRKAQDTLRNIPEDPDANTVAGKYTAFVLGDYDQGMVYLAKSLDKTLRALAEHEKAPLYADTAVKQVGMGDEWVSATKSFPALFRIFYDRASFWYTKAWPDLKDEPLWGDKLRERGRKIAVSRPPGASKKVLPSGWQVEPGVAGVSPILDGSVAHTGSYSVKMLPADGKVNGSASVFSSDLVPINGKVLEIAAYVLTDGTENSNDKLDVDFFDQSGVFVTSVSPFVPMDVPFWSRIYVKTDVPRNAARAKFKAIYFSKKGSMWVDDISLKVDGKELIKNPSFEDR